MSGADGAAQGAQGAVVGDERGQCGVGAFDHAGVPEVGKLGGAARHIAEEALQ